MTAYKRSFMANGAIPGLVMSAKESLSVEQMLDLKATIDAELKRIQDAGMAAARKRQEAADKAPPPVAPTTLEKSKDSKK